MKKIGLALGSGSARALANVGVIKVLKKNNIPIDFIAGASMGALIATYYALYQEVGGLEKVLTSLRKRNLLRLIDPARPTRAIIRGEKIKSFLKEYVGDKTFKDTRIPLALVTTDLRTGEDVVLRRGKLLDAMRASISLPGIFLPVEIDGCLLVDGGVTNPTPVDVVKKMGAEVIIGVDVTTINKVNLNNPNIVETIMQSFDIIRTQATKYKLEKVNGNLVIIKPEIPNQFNQLSFLEAAKFIREGELAAEKALPRIKKLLK